MARGQQYGPYVPNNYNPYGNRGYSRGAGSYGRPQRANAKKHSGARRTVAKTGAQKGSPVTTGWNYSRKNGLVTFLAVCTKGTTVHPSKTGKSWLNVMVKVQKKFEKEVIVSGLMEESTGRVMIPDWNWVIKPSAPNGGYCGKIK